MTEIDVPALAERIVERAGGEFLRPAHSVALARAYLAERAGREAAEASLSRLSLLRVEDGETVIRANIRAEAAEQQVAELRMERDRLRAALVEYGDHGSSCSRRVFPRSIDCTCGFDAALEPQP